MNGVSCQCARQHPFSLEDTGSCRAVPLWYDVIYAIQISLDPHQAYGEPTVTKYWLRVLFHNQFLPKHLFVAFAPFFSLAMDSHSHHVLPIGLVAHMSPSVVRMMIPSSKDRFSFLRDCFFSHLTNSVSMSAEAGWKKTDRGRCQSSTDLHSIKAIVKHHTVNGYPGWQVQLCVLKRLHWLIQEPIWVRGLKLDKVNTINNL